MTFDWWMSLLGGVGVSLVAWWAMDRRRGRQR